MGLHSHRLLILRKQPAADPDLRSEMMGCPAQKGSSVGAVNNGKPLSSAQLTFWQPPANSILIGWLGRTIHWSSLWMNATSNSAPIEKVLGTILDHCLPSLLQTVGKGKVRASIGEKVLLFLVFNLSLKLHRSTFPAELQERFGAR